MFNRICQVAPMCLMSDDTLRAVRKQLNRPICRFGCALAWDEGSTVQSFLPGRANMPTSEGTMVPSGKYD